MVFSNATANTKECYKKDVNYRLHFEQNEELLFTTLFDGSNVVPIEIDAQSNFSCISSIETERCIQMSQSWAHNNNKQFILFAFVCLRS